MMAKMAKCDNMQGMFELLRITGKQQVSSLLCLCLPKTWPSLTVAIFLSYPINVGNA